MADPTIEMNERATKRAIWFVILVTGIIVIQICWKLIIPIIGKVVGGDTKVLKDTDDLIKAGFALLVGILAALLPFFADLNVHNLIDKYIFGLRRKVEKIITQQLLASATRLNIDGAADVLSDPKNPKRIFYHFANRQEALRNGSFMLWGNIRQYLYSLLIATIAFVISFAIAIPQKDGLVSWAAPACLLLIVIIYSCSRVVWLGAGNQRSSCAANRGNPNSSCR